MLSVTFLLQGSSFIGALYLITDNSVLFPLSGLHGLQGNDIMILMNTDCQLHYGKARLGSNFIGAYYKVRDLII